MTSTSLAKFQKRVLSDTGILARELLGYTYDEDEGGRRLNVGKGGIVPYGKHQEIVELLDDRSLHYKLILAPRASRKSTILQAFCVRQILRNPDIRIFYGARTDAMVQEKALAIRNQLERKEVTAVFGEQVGMPWEADRFSVVGRKHVGLMNPTLQTFSFESIPHGGRANIIILDDFIDETNCTNQEQLEKARRKWHSIQPLLEAGGQLIVVGTVWDDEDIYYDMEGSQLFSKPDGGQIVTGAGVRLFYNNDGDLLLEEEEGGITFPHLTVEFLTRKLWGMMRKGQSPIHFIRQYLNQRTEENASWFHREDFRSVKWDHTMEQLTGYLLTDTATSKKKEGCYSVIAYVGLDAHDHIYVLDCRVGHWDQNEFIENFFSVLELWQPRVNHAGECWEKAQLADVYMDAVTNDSRARKTRLRPITMTRGTQSDSKPNRILRLQHPMRNRRFWVVDTVPQTFDDIDGPKELWNPIGYHDPRSGKRLPSGELVDEFLRKAAKKDVADTLAMILEYQFVRGRKPQRICSYKEWRPKDRPRPLTEQRQEAYRAAEYSQEPTGQDWWDRTLNDIGY